MAANMTTRVSHAIETLSGLFGAFITLSISRNCKVLTLDAVEDYEAEWSVHRLLCHLASLLCWPYLFPENLLHVKPTVQAKVMGLRNSRKIYQDYPFCSRLRVKLPLTYGNYFEDICNLEVQASCQVRTRRLI